MSATLAVFGGAVAAGVLGSGHCAAMCGPFAGWAGGQRAGVGIDLPTLTRRTAAYQLGRLMTYLSVGIVAGVMGAAIADASAFSSARGVAAVLTAALLFVAGLSQLLPGRKLGPPGVVTRSIGALVGLAGSAGPTAGPLLLGAAAGLLPCGLLWGFALAAAAAGSLGAAVAIMAGLWLGSAPALVAVAAAAGVLRGGLAKHGRRAVGLALIALAVVSLVQRWPAASADATPACHHHNK